MRVVTYLWFHFIMLITGWLPDFRPFLRLRGFLLRPAFKECGRGVEIGRRVTINFPNRLEIGDSVYIALGCWVNAWGGITLEDEVQLGPYVVLATADHILKDRSYRYCHGALAPIRICRGAWVAAHATVTRGVTIGSGALLAANSVATNDIPELTVAGGVPARVVRSHVTASSASA